MKKTKRLALFISLVIIFTSITVPMDVSAATTSVQSITLNVKPKITMYVGMKKKLKVKSVTPKGSSKKAVFTSSDSEVLKVSNTGAMEAKAEGKASITATSVTDEAVSREVSVTVKNLVKNKTYNKMVIALDKKKKTKKLSLASKVKAVNLSFASSKKKVAVVSKAGVVRVKKVGKSKITIKGKKGVVKGAKQVITLYVAKKSVKSVALNKESVSMKPEEKLFLTTTVAPAEAANVVYYESSDKNVAIVDQNGNVKAVKEGTAKITATTVDGNKKAVCTLTVEKSATSDDKTTEKSTTDKNQKKDNQDKPGDQENPGDKGNSGNQEKPDVSPAGNVGLKDLEEVYPKEPEYPEVNVQDDYTKTVASKDALLSLDVPAGTIVKTNGYYSENDGGQAVYEIMTYDDWWSQLPIELKMVTYHSDRIGANQVFYKNPVDNYGNHRLNNGMVAKLLPNEDGYVRVEQWGLFPGRKDNNRALIHIFAYNHTNSKILFGKDAKYELYYDTKNQGYQNQNGVINSIPSWLGVNSIGNNGNEYAVMLHCRQTSKPAIGDAQNVELCGNGCTITIPENEFCKGGSADFAMFETGGYVDGLSIHGFNFDSNGLQQYQYYDESKEEYVNMRTTNHTISYFSAAFNVGLGDKESTTAVTDGNGEKVMGDTTWAEVKNYNKREKMCFNNVDIYGNTFLANGTSVDIPDGGGDDILIINPEESNNVNIHNNKMYNWGRWAFSIDLGGNGERFYNYSFKQNICIQDEKNVTYSVDGTTATPTGRNRGLGWIDFEARKCFTNLDVSENYVYGANGWAFNGNGRISENITINGNTIERPPYTWKSIYPYAFYFYYVDSKDIKVTNNNVSYGGWVHFGNLSYNMLLEENDFGNTSFSITNPLGDVVIRNNTCAGYSSCYNIATSSDISDWIEDENSEYYLPLENRKADILFEGNVLGNVTSDIIVTDPDTDYRKNITLQFKDNTFSHFNVNAIGVKDYYFSPDQLESSEVAWSARGCKYSSTVGCQYNDNPVPGGLYYKKGDLVTNNLAYAYSIAEPKYFSELFTDLLNADGSIKGDKDIYCTKDGVFPINGEDKYCNPDVYFEANKEYSAGTFIYTEDNLYYVKTKGTTGTEIPNHTSGIAVNGTAELMWVAPIARYEMRDKK